VLGLVLFIILVVAGFFLSVELLDFFGLDKENTVLNITIFIGVTVALYFLIALTIRLLVKFNELTDKLRITVYKVVQPIVLAGTFCSVVALGIMLYMDYYVSWVELYILLKPYFPIIASVYAFLLVLYMLGECPKCTSIHFSTITTSQEGESVEYGTKDIGDSTNKSFVAHSSVYTQYGVANRVCSSCGHKYTKRWKVFSINK
jgi:uncharacterized protein YacL